jgi:hypothetical protein
MFFGIRATTIKMLAPINEQKRTTQIEIKDTKFVDESEAFLRKQAYSDVKINTDESFYNDSDLENTEYFLVLVYHKKTKTPLLSCRYYFDKRAILKAISGDQKQNNTNLEISENNNEVFLADRLSGNTSNSIYKRNRGVVFGFFYNEIIKNNRNKNLLLMARSDEQERLLTKYLRIGFNVIGNTKHKGVKHWIVFSELNKSYSFFFRQVKLFLFLKVTTKGFK